MDKKQQIINRLGTALQSHAYDDYATYVSIKEGNTNYLSNTDQILERFNITEIPGIPYLSRILAAMTSSTMALIPEVKIDNEYIQEEWNNLWDASYMAMFNAVLDAIGYGIGHVVMKRNGDNKIKLVYVDPYLAKKSDTSAYYIEYADDLDGGGVEFDLKGIYKDLYGSKNKFKIHFWSGGSYCIVDSATEDIKEVEYGFDHVPIGSFVVNHGGSGPYCRAIALYKWGLGSQRAIDMNNLALLAGADNSIFPTWMTSDDNITVGQLTAPKAKIIKGQVALLDYPNIEGDYLAIQNHMVEQIYHILGINKLSAGSYIPNTAMSGVALNLLLQSAGNTIGRIANAVIDEVRNLACSFVKTMQIDNNIVDEIDISISTDITSDNRLQYESMKELVGALQLPLGTLIRYNPYFNKSVKKDLENQLEVITNSNIEDVGDGVGLEDSDSGAESDAETQARMQLEELQARGR